MLVSFPPLLFPEGVGAATLGFERPNRFIRRAPAFAFQRWASDSAPTMGRLVH